jgi:hypothetical protein
LFRFAEDIDDEALLLKPRRANAFGSFLEKNKASKTNDFCILVFSRNEAKRLFRFAENIDYKIPLLKPCRANAFGYFLEMNKASKANNICMLFFSRKEAKAFVQTFREGG